MQQELDAADLLDPNPDIHALFCHYNELYFEGKLQACTVDWSTSRMTLCAGICKFGEGGGCAIRLSEPLLNDHGPCFQAVMQEINTSKVLDHQRPEAGYCVTIYHNFNAEVDNYRRHHWKCARCGEVIKRAMNRPPSQMDCIQKSAMSDACEHDQCHWHRHKRLCGGEYEKIAEPAGYQDRRKKSSRLCGKEDAEASNLSAAKSDKQSGRKKKGNVIEIDADESRNKGELTHARVSKTGSLEKFFPVKQDRDKQEELAIANTDTECLDNQIEEEGKEKRAKRRKADENENTEGASLPREINQESRGLLGKRQERTPEIDSSSKPANDFTVIIAWKGWCAFEGEEDENIVEALVNKRRQGRMVQVKSEAESLEVSMNQVPSLHDERNITHSREMEQDNETRTMPLGVNSPVQYAEESREMEQDKESMAMPLGVTSPLQYAEESMPVNFTSQQRNDPNMNDLEEILKDSKNPSFNEIKRSDSEDGCAHIFLHTSLDTIPVKTDVGIMKHQEEDEGMTVAESGDLISIPQVSNSLVSCSETFLCASNSNEYQKSDAARAVTNFMLNDEANIIEIEARNNKSNPSDVHEVECEMYDVAHTEKFLPIHGHERLSGASETISEVKANADCLTRVKTASELREQKDGFSAIAGPSVTCPICSTIFAGDIRDAGFNTQINQHIDACVSALT